MPNNSIESDFAYFYLHANRIYLQTLGQGSTFTELSKQKLASFRIALPPLTEQTTIAEYLDRLTSTIDTAIANTRRELELLEEYRTRLISDVVTGQVDVREAAALIEAKQGAAP